MTNQVKQDSMDPSPCRTIGRRLRFPNVMPDVDLFLDRWNRSDRVRPPARLRRSPYGNINTVGLPGVHEADDLDPAHPDWIAGIESGISPLVTILTSGGWSLITYDSCQGHFYSDATALTPTVRQVGVLPRDPAERTAAAAALCRTIGTARPGLPASIRISLNGSVLDCGRTGNVYEVLDLSLEPAPGIAWQRYFAEIDAATGTLAAAMADHRPIPNAPCACPPS